MKHKFLLCATLSLALTAGGAITAFAVEAEENSTSYGYLAGHHQSSTRHGQFEAAGSLSTDAEREAYFESHDIGGGHYSESRRLDASALVAAGVIDQAAADSIGAYASSKHDQIHSRYQGDMSDMTPDERHTLYDGYGKDGFDGDMVDELLNAGVITQEQADAINAYGGF